jgi:HNH endonuclease
MRGLCVVDSCGRESLAKGLCSKHYSRMRIWGTVERENIYTPPNTKWVELEQYPGYKVSEYGHLMLINGNSSCSPGHIYKGHINSLGYKMYRLKNRQGDWEAKSAHVLTALAFIGNCPTDKDLVAHNDGNPGNNHYSNLRWATTKENAEDKIRHGRSMRGTKHHNCKLSKKDVIEIREAYEGKYGQLISLGRKYGVSAQQIRRVAIGEQWQDVEKVRF